MSEDITNTEFPSLASDMEVEVVCDRCESSAGEDDENQGFGVPGVHPQVHGGVEQRPVRQPTLAVQSG